MQIMNTFISNKYNKMANKKAEFEMQEVFIKHLKQIVPANVSLVDDIADLLKISNDSALLIGIWCVCYFYFPGIGYLFNTIFSLAILLLIVSTYKRISNSLK